MKHVFLINSFTIGKKINKVKESIENVCKNMNIDFLIEINDEVHSTEQILQKYKNAENIILAVGGDGIINRVLNEIIGTKNQLGFIPCGTGNDLYRSLNIQAIETTTKCDIAKINDKYFINVACFGIDADVANNLSTSKLIPKKQKYNLSVINSFAKYKGKRFEVLINDEKIEDDFATIAVCNGMFYGGGYNIAPSSELTDGLLDVYLATTQNRITIMKLILSMKKGKHENNKKIRKIKADKLSIISPISIRSNIDGEELEAKRFDIEIIEKGIIIYFNKELIASILKNIN